MLSDEPSILFSHHLWAISLATGCGMALLALAHAIFGALFLRRLWSGTRAKTEGSSYAPRAAIILAVRGPDPNLTQTLQGLLIQNYQDYTVYIVVDSDQDPALPVIEDFLTEHRPGNVEVQVMTRHVPTCSLKCGALAEMVRRLSGDYEVIAFIDADAPPHRDWLRNMIAPLEDLSIGVTTGNRWFIPGDNRWGTIVRYLWNVAAIVQVWMNQITWAGSMAMRAELARNSDLTDAWERALSVDATVTRFVKRRKLKVHFVPFAIMPNEESIGLAEFRPWVERQLVAARTSGSGWLLISFHAFGVVAIPLMAMVVLLWAVSAGAKLVALWLGIAVVAYCFTNLLSLALLEIMIRRILAINATRVGRIPAGAVLRLFPAMILCHAIYARALLRANFADRIYWRGIEYRIYGPNNIRMTSYHPYTKTSERSPRDSVV